MPTPSGALAARLTTYGGLTALVSAAGVYPGRAPQEKDLPLVAFERIASSRESAFVSDSNIVGSFWRITCMGRTYDETEAVHDQVRKALQRWRGSSNGVTVHDTLIETEAGPSFLGDPPLYESFVDVQLRTTEV